MHLNRLSAWLLPAVAGVIILFPAGYSVGRFAWASVFSFSKPYLELPDASSGSCVRDPSWMRQNHRILLRELRDKTVREGIRSKITLGTCSHCHKDKTRFCDKCHLAVNLYPDCFDCHFYSTAGPMAARLEGKP